MAKGSDEPVDQGGTRRRVSDVLADGIQSWAIVLVAFTTVVSAAYAIGVGSDVGDALTIAATALALAASSALIGAVVGLLFGMPREADRRAGATSSSARYATNSNLLKVSDWITTILVGLSLVSIRSIPSALRGFSDWVSDPLGSEPSSGAFGLFVAGASFTAMFMLMFVWSTVPLRSHLEGGAAESEELWERPADASEGLPTSEQIAKALSTVSIEKLERIKQDVAGTPTLIRDLAELELERRAGGNSL